MNPTMLRQPDIALLLRELEEAVRAEHEARRAVSAATERVARAVRALQDRGVPSSVAACRVAHATGQVPGVELRRRIASRLRQLKSRVTRRRGFQATPDSCLQLEPLGCARKEGTDMPGRVVKRTTVTEEFIENPKAANENEEIDQEDSDFGDDGDVEAEEERSRSRRKR